MSEMNALVRRFCSGRVVRGTLATAGLLVLFVGNGAGCSTGNNVSSIEVPMEYTPRSTELPAMRAMTGKPVKLYVSPTVDNRSDPRTIGKNTQDEVAIPVYAAGKTPAEFVTEVLKQEMTAAGLEVTGDKSDSQRQINAELLQFDVTEGGTYNGIVRIRVKVVDRAGKEIFTGVGSGTKGNFGKSKSPINYQETFSDALRQAVLMVLSDSKFADALGAE